MDNIPWISHLDLHRPGTVMEVVSQRLNPFAWKNRTRVIRTLAEPRGSFDMNLDKNLLSGDVA